MSENEIYYATYCRPDFVSGDSHVLLDGNSIIVGAELTMTKQVHVTKRGKEVPRIIVSRGDQAIGFLPENVFKQVDRCLDEGWICRAFSSLVAYNRTEEYYWTEIAVICYRPEDASIFGPLVAGLVRRIAKGDHPVVSLSPKELAQVVDSSGEWDGFKSQKLPKLEKGSAYYKTKRSFSENMAYAAAEGNKGCYVALFLVVFCIVFSIIWFFFLR